MSEAKKRPTGWTKNTGYQIGVRRTLPIEHRTAWRLVTSTPGLNLWLGPTGGIDLEEGIRYELDDGSNGEMRVISPGSHLRLTWDPGGWKRPSTIQVRIIPNGDRTIVAFHQEHLPGTQQREKRRAHFKAALDGLEALITEGK